MPGTEAEPMPITQYIEKTLTGNEPPRCVDGRPSDESPQGPQMLGGSLHPLVLSAIINNQEFSVPFVYKGLKTLRESGFRIGVHRGHHKDEIFGKSDCGFSDRLKDIVQTAKENKPKIIEGLEAIYKENGISTDSLRSSFDLISNYSLFKIKIKGEELIKFAEDSGASLENLEGDHGEQVAFVNLKPNTTLDTRALNDQGKQAFNLDLWEALKEGRALAKDSNDETLRDLSLILYQATEMILVEQKGKPALPVILNK